MTNQIKVVLDLMAGILAGLQVLLPNPMYERMDSFLLGQLQGTVTKRGSLRWLWLIGAGILAVATIVAIVFKGMVTDLKNGHVEADIFLIVGFLVGMVILGLMTRFVRSNGSKPTWTALVSGMVLGILSWLIAILLIGRASVNVISFLVAFSISIMIMGISIGAMPMAQRFLTFKSGVLLRFGVILFIAARIIELRLT